MIKNKVARALHKAHKEKIEIKAHIRLKKNGQFSSVYGLVSDIKVSADGIPYMVFRGGKKDYQSVPLENVLAVVIKGEIYKR